MAFRVVVRTENGSATFEHRKKRSLKLVAL